jgi:hypothetical protein
MDKFKEEEYANLTSASKDDNSRKFEVESSSSTIDGSKRQGGAGTGPSPDVIKEEEAHKEEASSARQDG